ncbi:MAG TPA: transposase [Cyclobacteriaceae bacterium]
MYSKQPPEFITVTCLKWTPVLKEDRLKDVVIESLNFLVSNQRIVVYGFVIMSNHFHLIWQMAGDHKREDVQRDFLKYTGQQLLKRLKEEGSELQKELLVETSDRKYQVWERNSLAVSLWSQDVFMQKLNYIHDNPVKAGLCEHPEDYKYSSARFYILNEKDWKFLSHYNG